MSGFIVGAIMKVVTGLVTEAAGSAELKSSALTNLGNVKEMLSKAESEFGNLKVTAAELTAEVKERMNDISRLEIDLTHERDEVVKVECINAELRAQLDALKEELSSKKKKLAGKKQKYKDFKKETKETIKRQKNENLELSEKLEKEKQDNEMLRDANETQEQELTQLNTTMKEKNSRLGELDAHLSHRNEQFAKQEQAVEDLKVKEKQLQLRLQDLHTKTQNQTAEQNKTEAERDQLRVKLADFETKVKNLEETVGDVAKKEREHSHKRDQHKEQQKAAEEEVEKSQRECIQLRNDKATALTKLEAATTKLAHVEKQLAAEILAAEQAKLNFETKLATVFQDCKDIQTEKRSQEELLYATNDKLSATDDELGRLKDAHKETHSCLKQTEEQLRAKETAETILIDKMKLLESEVSELKKHSELQAAKIRDLEQSMQEKISMIELLEEQNQTSEQHLAVMTQKCEEALQNWNQVCDGSDRLQRMCSDLNEELSAAKAENHALRSRLSKTECDYSETKEQLRTIAADKATLGQRCNDFEAEINQLKRKGTRLEGDITAISAKLRVAEADLQHAKENDATRKAENERMQNYSCQQTTKVKELTLENAKLRQDLRHKTTALVAARESEVKLSSDSRVHQRAFSDLRAKCEADDKVIRRLEQDRDEAGAKRINIENRLKVIIARHEHARDEVDYENQAAATRTETKRFLLDELEKLNKTLNGSVPDDQAAQIRSSMKDMNEKLRQIDDDIRAAQREKSRKEKVFDDMTKQKTALEQQLHETSELRDEKQRQLQEREAFKRSKHPAMAMLENVLPSMSGVQAKLNDALADFTSDYSNTAAAKMQRTASSSSAADGYTE